MMLGTRTIQLDDYLAEYKPTDAWLEFEYFPNGDPNTQPFVA